VADGDDVFVTTLLNPDEYAKHRNQVAGLTTRNIKFLNARHLPPSRPSDWLLEKLDDA